MGLQQWTQRAAKVHLLQSSSHLRDTRPLSKLKTFFWALLAIASTLSPIQGSCSEFIHESTPCWFSQPLFEVKTGYFFFSNSKMRRVYDSGGFDIQLSASYPLWSLTSKWSLNAYGALEYFYLSGKSLNGGQKTAAWSIPFNVGLQPIYALNANSHYYFSIGPRSFYLNQHNHSSYVYDHASSVVLGFFLNTGLHHLLYNHFVLDLFGEYSYAKMHFQSSVAPYIYTRNIQVGGFTFGGGLGYTF